MTKPKFFITTLGCKVNQFESEAISTCLSQHGWEQINGKGAADVCIINTCTVTGKASMQSRQAIRQAIRSNPGARIIVTGCYAQTGAADIRNINGVDEIVGHDDKHKIPEALIHRNQLPYPLFPENDQCKATIFQQIPVTVCNTRSRPFLKIQDGCNAFCTYCIVPYARGRSRSMPVKEVLRHLAALSESGYHEVVLTGIHMGCYGLDLHPPTTFTRLLQRISAEKVIRRVRLSSIEPRELTDELIETVAGSDQFCRHFHIPLQSGDDHILERMHRPYDTQWFRNRIQSIHQKLPEAAIGVDTLIGFPGETDTAFENTRNLIDNLPISYLHVFPFSPRKGTPASDYADPVAPDVIKERCSVMRMLGKHKKAIFYDQQLKTSAEVLIERQRDRRSGLLKGISSNYVTVLTDGPDQLKNSLVTVRLEKMCSANAIMGIRIT